MVQETVFVGEKPKLEISDVFCATMEKLILEDPKVVYVDADLMGSMKSKLLWEKYPKNVFNTGIQEANMVGVAAGLYLTGMKPYIHSFAPFASRRVFDQVFLSVGYAHKSVRIIGSDVGIMATYNGGTHMCFEDTAMMRTVPDACVIDVSDAQMFDAFLQLTKDRPGVTYFRTPRRDLPDIYPKGTVFAEGKGKLLSEGRDVTLVASGIMVATALETQKVLADEGIFAQVIDIITVKPLDSDLLLESAKKTGAIVTAENHNILGGLGAAVCELVCEEYPVPVVRVGVKDSYGQVGCEAFLREQYHLTVVDMVKAAKQAIQKKLDIKA